MLRLTGEHADGWLPAWKMTAQQYAEKRAVIARHATAAGRPMPESALFAAVLLGHSRSRLLETIDASPQMKTLAAWAPGEAWERHGLTHPAGRESRGLVDVIIHDIDPQELLDLSESVPAALLEEFYFMGNVDELLGAFEEFAKRGLEHIVIGDCTGSLGGLEEATARAPDMLRLRRGLAAL
jgi:phthiodiolone/phenolphthiodiolone dimycocerosates ketoreductase